MSRPKDEDAPPPPSGAGPTSPAADVPAPPADLADPAAAPSDDFPARLAALRELLRDPPQDDTVAERYNELVDAARGDTGRTEAVRWLGEQLRAMQERDELPRTMIARAPRRPRPGSS